MSKLSEELATLDDCDGWVTSDHVYRARELEAEVARLRADLDGWKKTARDMEYRRDCAAADRDNYFREVDRLREAVKALESRASHRALRDQLDAYLAAVANLRLEAESWDNETYGDLVLGVLDKLPK